MDNINHSKKQSIKLLVAAIALSASLSASWAPSKFCDLGVGIQGMTNDGTNLYVRPNTETSEASIIRVDPKGDRKTLDKTTLSGASGGIAYVDGNIWACEKPGDVSRIRQINTYYGTTNPPTVTLTDLIVVGLTGDTTTYKYPYAADQVGNIYKVFENSHDIRALPSYQLDTSVTASVRPSKIFGITSMKGELYLTDCNSNRILKAKLNDKTTTVSFTSIEMSAGSLDNPRGITSDGTNLFVVNGGTKSVSKITVNEAGPATVSTIADLGKVSDPLTSPAAITFMDGALYVAGVSTSANGRIVKLKENRINFVTGEEVASDIAAALLDAANTAQGKVDAAIKPFVTSDDVDSKITAALEKVNFMTKTQVASDIAAALLDAANTVQGKITAATTDLLSASDKNELIATLNKDRAAQAQTIAALTQSNQRMKHQFSQEIAILKESVEQNISILQAALEREARERRAGDAAARKWWWWT
ncbi:MAG: hypothetical protein NT128_01020 [Proteobacteria bacterium]|nr:hypothetical protein [Pseudomonadota bacterium]